MPHGTNTKAVGLLQMGLIMVQNIATRRAYLLQVQIQQTYTAMVRTEHTLPELPVVEAQLQPTVA